MGQYRGLSYFFTKKSFTRKVTEIIQKFRAERLQDDQAVQNRLPATVGTFSLTA